MSVTLFYVKARVDTNYLELLLLFVSETIIYKTQRRRYVSLMSILACSVTVGAVVYKLSEK